MTAQEERERESLKEEVCAAFWISLTRMIGCGCAQNSQNSKKIHWPTYLAVLWLAQRRKVGTATRLAINALLMYCASSMHGMGWRRLGRASGRNE
jgi:hypothetical protein